MNNQIENQVENLNQRVEVIEESQTLIIKKIAVEHKRVVDKLVEYQQKVDAEHDHTKEIVQVLMESRKELKIMAEINNAHYNARDHVDQSVVKVKQYIEQAADYFSEAFYQLDNKIKALPSKYEVKHHHHLTRKSTGLIAVWVVLVLGFITSLSWGISNQIRISEIKGDQVKLHLMKMGNPSLYMEVDSLFEADPDQAKGFLTREKASSAVISK